MGKIATTVMVVLMLALGGWIWLSRHDAGIRRLAALDREVAVLDSVHRVQRVAAKTSDTVYLTDTMRLTRTVTRIRTRLDSALRTTTDTVRLAVNEALDSVQRACQTVIASCERRVAIRDSLIETMRRRGELLRQRPNVRDRRWSLFTEGLYDVVGAQVVARAGSELRLFGPVSATGVVEADPTRDRLRDDRVRVRAGLRFTFR